MHLAEILLVIALLAGFVGTIVPMLPGMGLIFAAVLLYGFYSDWLVYSPAFAVLVGVLTVLSMAIDYLSQAMGAKKFGAGKHGVWGSLIGGVIGMVLLGFIGLILGSIVGLVAVEYYEKRDMKQSTKAAAGVLAGTVVGMVLQGFMALAVAAYVISRLG